MSGEVLGVQLEMGLMGEVEGERFREVWQERALERTAVYRMPSSADMVGGHPAKAPTNLQAPSDIQRHGAIQHAFHLSPRNRSSR
jgi:hypothetical protein